ncbi:MAG: hypothetical protein WC832_06710 [Anaerolineales bacterium]
MSDLPYKYGPLFAAIGTTGSGEVAKADIRFPGEFSALLLTAELMTKVPEHTQVVIYMGELHDGVGDLVVWKDGDYTEAVKTALAAFGNPDPVLGFADFLMALATASVLKGQWNEDHGDFHTTSLFWDCECMGPRFIHPFTETHCDHCGAEREGSPDSRIKEILAHWQRMGLHPALVQIIKNANCAE